MNSQNAKINRKSSLLYLTKLLIENTDDQHPLTTTDIISYFAGLGLTVDRKTLKADINLIFDFGIDVISIKSSQNKYFIGQRQFQIPELKLLIDAVESSKFITAQKSAELVEELSHLASKNQAEILKRQLYVPNRIKSENEQIYYVVDIINEAINSGKKIQFKYFEYTPKKKKVFRNNGELYVISQYALFWNEDHYYLIGHSEKHNKIVKFRVDRMYSPKQSFAGVVKTPVGFNIAEYTKHVLEMYDGEPINVELQCSNELMKVIINRFGENVDTKLIDKLTFKAKLVVSKSPTFFGWVFQFGGKIRILSPKSVKDEYDTMLTRALQTEAGKILLMDNNGD